MIGLRSIAVRAVTAVLGGFVAGAIAVATPAIADITVTPSVGVRGGAAKLTLRVPDERAPAHTTQVVLYLPEDAPIAETYPLTVPDWAPRITMRKLSQPIEAVHGIQTTEVVSHITWIRVSEKPPTPGAAVELMITLGPMPDRDRLLLTVVQTYSDGTVVRWADPPTGGSQASGRPAPVLKLVPAPARHSAHGAQASEDTTPGFGLLRTVLLSAAISGMVLCGWIAASRLRRRRRTVSDDPA